MRGINRIFSQSIFFKQLSQLYERTLVNSDEKHNIICWRLIWRTKTDYTRCLCKFPAFDVAESRFPKTFCSAGRTIGPKEFMAANHVPVRRIRPSFGFVVATTILPYELGDLKRISHVYLDNRTSGVYRKARYRGHCCKFNVCFTDG
jgi:hypothetical protein